MTATRVHLVLVHGLFSSAAVWDRFAELVEGDPELAGQVVVRRFAYSSPKGRLRPDRRIAETDDIADQLGTYLEHQLAGAERIVLVTHSQGGLVVQRFLHRKLADGRGAELTRIKFFLMLACPNTGSGFFLTLRRLLPAWHPQEKQLRPFDRAVTEAQRTVLNKVVYARAYEDKQCPVPVRAYGGSDDDIVPAVVARGLFPEGGVVPGDHFSVIQPKDRNHDAYLAVRAALRSVLDSAEATPPDITAAVGTGEGGSAAAEMPELTPSPQPPYAQLADGTLKGEDRIGLVAELLAEKAGQQVHVVAGMGGSGKSRIALETASRAEQAGRRVWWVSMPELSHRMRGVALDLGASVPTVERAWIHGRHMDLVWELLDACPDPWLLVFDNADDPERLVPQGDRLSDRTGWLRTPAGPHGTVVVTSRTRSEYAWGGTGCIHQVPLLDEEDGAAMLMERTGGIGGTNEEARALSRELGGLPLVLRYAADAIKAVSDKHVRVPMGSDSAISTFEKYRETVSTSAAGEGGQLTELFGREIVEKVCGISMSLLTAHNLPRSPTLLKVFACLSIVPIPYSLLLDPMVLARSPLFPGATRDSVQNALAGLEELGLIDVHETPGGPHGGPVATATLHPFVHGVLREDAEVHDRPDHYYGLALRMLHKASEHRNPDHPANWPLWASLAPHALEVTRTCLLGGLRLDDRTVRKDALELARLTARYLIATGLLTPAADLVVPLIERCADYGFDAGDREILGLRHEHGRVHLDREELTRAEEVLRAVVEERARILGRNDADTLASRHKLARAINEQRGREQEAEEMLRSIVEAEKQVRGHEHYDTLVVRHTLARTVQARSLHAEAEREARQILDISRRNNWPPATPEMLRVRETLSHALLSQDRADEAEGIIRQALDDASQPADSNLVMRLRYTFVLVLLGIRGRTSDAVAELRRLHGDLERSVDADHPLYVQVRVLLTRTIQEMPTRNPGPNNGVDP